MWEVFAEIWFILLVSALIGLAIGYIISSIFSTSKIEMLEEENWQLKEDLRKYRNSVSLLETEIKHIKDSDYLTNNSVSASAIKEYTTEIEKLKSKIEVLKNESSSEIHQRYAELQESHQDLLSEREKLLVKLDDLSS